MKEDQNDYRELLESLKIRGITDFKALIKHYKIRNFSDLDNRLSEKKKDGKFSQEESNLMAEARWRRFLGL